MDQVQVNAQAPISNNQNSHPATVQSNPDTDREAIKEALRVA